MQQVLPKIQFAYWGTRGKAQPLRFLLEYVEANYEEKRYKYANPGEWFEQDKKQQKPFPNLPSIKDEQIYLTEHETLIKYIVKSHPKYIELLGVGKGNDEFVIDQLVNVINDIRQLIRNLFFNPNVHSDKRQVLTNSLPKFQQLVDFKASNPYLLPYLTVADFKFVELLLYFKILDQEFFIQNYPSLEEYVDRFYNLPRIAAYVRSDRYRTITEFFPVEKAVLTGADFLIEQQKKFQATS